MDRETDRETETEKQRGGGGGQNYGSNGRRKILLMSFLFRNLRKLARSIGWPQNFMTLTLLSVVLEFYSGQFRLLQQIKKQAGFCT